MTEKNPLPVEQDSEVVFASGKLIKRKNRSKHFIKDIIVLVVATVILSFLIQTFVARVFYVPTTSMEPTLDVNDRIVVSQLYPEIGGVHRGDIVVFKDPGGWLKGTSGESFIVKRVIGTPGDEVACCDEFGRLTVNGEPITEPYLEKGTAPSNVSFDETVPEGMLWVMGDNRDVSLDSRFQSGSENGKFVPIEDVVGQAMIRFYPLERLKLLIGS